MWAFSSGELKKHKQFTTSLDTATGSMLQVTGENTLYTAISKKGGSMYLGVTVKEDILVKASLGHCYQGQSFSGFPTKELQRLLQRG